MLSDSREFDYSRTCFSNCRLQYRYHTRPSQALTVSLFANQLRPVVIKAPRPDSDTLPDCLSDGLRIMRKSCIVIVIKDLTTGELMKLEYASRKGKSPVGTKMSRPKWYSLTITKRWAKCYLMYVHSTVLPKNHRTILSKHGHCSNYV